MCLKFGGAFTIPRETSVRRLFSRYFTGHLGLSRPPSLPLRLRILPLLDQKLSISFSGMGMRNVFVPPPLPRARFIWPDFRVGIGKRRVCVIVYSVKARILAVYGQSITT